MADKTQIIDAIEGLAVHCRPPLMSIEQRALWMRTWCEDLAEFPADAILAACRKYRQSEATKFPTPGQLMPMIRYALPTAAGEKINVEWAPISDSEYAALSVRDKIRHRMILAHEARIKAGPMFINVGSTMSRASGKRIAAEDMPATWRKWSEIADNHEAEAKRLRQHLRDVA